MKLYAGVTDHDWFDYLRSLPAIDEVNFWQHAIEFNKIMTQKNKKGTQVEIEILIDYNDR
jgi:hypothetical protein